MTLSVILGFVWLIAANVLAMVPSKDDHWARAYGLIAVGMPLLVWIFWENGALVGLLALAGGVSVLRWPVRYLLAWLRRVIGGAH